MNEDPGVNPGAGAADGGPALPPHEDPADPAVEPVDEEAAAGEAEDPLARAEAERDQYLESLRRLKAEFDNFRKRSERDRHAQAAAAEQELIKSLLPVVDNLQRAVTALDQAGDVSTGVDMVRVQLADVLASRGLAAIEADGASFDPHLHEAVATVPSADQAPGTIIEVVQPGYVLGDTVIRPSTVVVAADA